MICRRATQRLTEYESMLEELSQKRTNAIILNKTEQAERLRLAMIDCRDTVLRAIHVDLLLGRDEVSLVLKVLCQAMNQLRAIGVNSDWARSS
ncbi:hypothetical protein OSTOST_09016 [Ostertagia ostertagi]